MFAWNSPTLAFDIAAIDRLREQCRTAIDLWVLTEPLSRPMLTSTDAPVDLTDLIGDNVPPVPVPPRPPSHFFECLIKDQDSAPIVGLRCLVEGPHADPVVVPTDQHGLIRFDDLPGPGDYQRMIRLEGLGITGDCELRFLEAV